MNRECFVIPDNGHPQLEPRIGNPHMVRISALDGLTPVDFLKKYHRNK
jgi:hypothetical protein